MGRPPLAVGTHGSVNVQETSPGRWRARTRFRDEDGRTRPVAAHATSRSAAVSRLMEALKHRRPPTGDGELTSSTRVDSWAPVWLASVDRDPKRKQATKDRYAWITEQVVTPGLGGLRVGECTPGRLDAFLVDVAERRGAATAKTTRAVLSMMLGAAVRRGALPSNPVRDVGAIGTGGRKPARALTLEEERKLLRKLDRDQLARDHDLPDLVRFMLGTGVRIGEACALREPQVDLGRGLVTVSATMTDHGLQEAAKSKAGHRVIAVPPHVVELLCRRLEDPRVRTDVALFPSPLGKLRDSSNTAAHLRRAFDRAGFGWVTSHVFRKTVATRLDEAGLSAREIADHLGHSQISMTTDVYMARRVASTRAAEALAVPN